jgi:hypothetical protein
MKFISKNSNLRVVLSPGIQANQLAGSLGKPGVYVKFQNGVAEIKDEKIIEMMTAHPGFNLDYIAVDEHGEDPFANQREEIEPVHVIQEMRYGHSEGKRISPNAKMKVDPLVQKLANEQAMKMLPDMLKAAMEKMFEMKDAKDKAEKEKQEENSVENASSLDNKPILKDEVKEKAEKGENVVDENLTSDVETLPESPIIVKPKGRPRKQ